MFIQEHNCETGEITLRELTAKEISEREKLAAKEQTEKATKVAAKAALLERLGISEDEARLLLS